MKTVTYLCGTDYRHEMDNGTAIYYDSIEKLKASSKCWEECGIVELWLDETASEIGAKWVEKPL